jgi:hypothetical protein
MKNQIDFMYGSGLTRYKCYCYDKTCQTQDKICSNSFYACSKQYAILQQIAELNIKGYPIPSDIYAKIQ